MGEENLIQKVLKHADIIIFIIIIFLIIFVANTNYYNGQISVCNNMKEFFRNGKCYTCEEIGGFGNNEKCYISQQNLKKLNISIDFNKVKGNASILESN